MSTALGDRLESLDPGERRAACQAVRDDPAAALFLEPLARRLGDSDPRVAQAAGDALVAIAKHEAEVPGLVRRVLRGPVRNARLPAAFTLARLEPPGPELFPALVAGLGHAAGPVRWAAARLLVEIGRLHGETLTLLIGLMGSSQTFAVRRMALYALRELAPDRPESASALLAASHSEDGLLQRAALLAMAGLFDPPPAVVARLEEAASGDDPVARSTGQAAMRALARRSGATRSP